MKEWFTAQEAAGLPGLPDTKRGTNIMAARESWQRRPWKGRGSGWEYHFSSFPSETRRHLIIQDVKSGDPGDPSGPEALRDGIQQQEATRRGPRKAGRQAKPLPQRLTEDEVHQLWHAFRSSPRALQEVAEKSLAHVHAYYRLQGQAMREGARKAAVAEAFGISTATLWRELGKVNNQDPENWLALLLPRPAGCQTEAEFTPEAWEFIKSEYGQQGGPHLSAVVDRARRVGEAHGWKIPSYRTLLRRVEALPHWWRVLTRQGPFAMQHLYPAQDRDYTTLQLHELWESDGHRADVFCVWPDGYVGRPIVLVWRDVRTRHVLGWAVGRTESADLIRLAFRNAAAKTQALPHSVLLDNGRGYASKLLSGGQKSRYRGKILEEDVLGIFTLFSIVVHWAQPEHGQSKPVESWFRTVTGRVSQHPTFAGAYCGNRPEAKPEEFDAKKAVPVEAFTERFEAEVGFYHERGHRGRGMDGRSPKQVYEELLAGTPIRTPTATQLRLCLMAAERVLLDAKDHSVRILGNRYWSEALVGLPNRGPYTVRFDPEDARVPVAVYDNGRYLCAAELRDPVGFLDQAAAKAHAKARRKFVKAKKDAEDARRQLVDVKPGWDIPHAPDSPETPSGLAGAKVAELVHPQHAKARATRRQQDEEDMAAFEASVAEGMKRISGDLIWVSGRGGTPTRTE